MANGDRASIHEVLVRYADCVDSRRFEDLREVFMPDATFGRDPSVEGVDAIIEHIRGMLVGCGPTQHLLANEMVAISDDEADVRSAVRAFHVGAGDRNHLTYEMFGEYEDAMVRTGSGWRIARRWLHPRIRLGPRSEVLGLG
jgi:3-phenylpropionate/cinnamic acid dioxygenase small subunit